MKLSKIPPDIKTMSVVSVKFLLFETAFISRIILTNTCKKFSNKYLMG